MLYLSMAIRVPLIKSEYYHIYNRGVDKREIFQDEIDRKRFISLLLLCNSDLPFHIANQRGSTSVEELGKPIVAIGAYCLMPNHFHILAREIKDRGITSFMHKLSTAYTMYFNLRRERTGALFQGRFKTKHVNSDAYLKYLFSYIHLNPLKCVNPNWRENGIRDIQKTRRFIQSYPYSSYLDLTGLNRESSKILNLKEFPDYFPLKISAIEELFDWISAYSSIEVQPRCSEVEPRYDGRSNRRR